MYKSNIIKRVLLVGKYHMLNHFVPFEPKLFLTCIKTLRNYFSQYNFKIYNEDLRCDGLFNQF